MDTLVDFLTLASAGLLAIPAWHFNRYARLSSRATLHRIRIADAEIARKHQAVLKELQELRDSWKCWKAWCLHIGTAAGLIAAALAAIDGLLRPPCGC